MADDFRVLIVDDDFHVAKLHAAYVDSVAGFLALAPVGTASLALQAIHSLRPDLVLLDVYLPDASGLDLLQQLDVDTIILSAASDPASVRVAFRRGALGYLLKPFTAESLSQQLRSYARYRRILAQTGNLTQDTVERAKRALIPGDVASSARPRSATEAALLDLLHVGVVRVLEVAGGQVGVPGDAGDGVVVGRDGGTNEDLRMHLSMLRAPAAALRQRAVSVMELSERELAGEFQGSRAGPGREALLIGGAAVEHAGEPGTPHPAAGLLRDQGAGGEVMFVEAAFAVGVVGAVGHEAEVQRGRSEPADVGEPVHQAGQAGRLFGADGRVTAEPRRQDLPGPAGHRAVERRAPPVVLNPGAVAAGGVVDPSQRRGVDDAGQPRAVRSGHRHRGAVVDDVADEVGGTVERVNRPAEAAGGLGQHGAALLPGDRVLGPGTGDDLADGGLGCEIEGRHPVPRIALVAHVQVAGAPAGQHRGTGGGGLPGQLQERGGLREFSPSGG